VTDVTGVAIRSPRIAHAPPRQPEKTNEGRLMQGGLHWFEDRKEKQFMFENYYSDNIPRRARFVKRQEFISTLKYVINKW
jgi:hypothetical protein